MPEVQPGTRVAVLVTGLVTASTAIVLGLGLLHPVDLLAPGTEGSARRAAIMQADFGAERIPERYGYDGQEFYLAARHLPDLDRAIAEVERPRMRMQRILMPAVASIGGQGTPVVLLLIASSILGLALATRALGNFAAAAFGSARYALAGTVMFVVPFLLTTSESLAFGLALTGLWCVRSDRPGWAAVALAAAGLTRETALTAAAAAAVLEARARRWRSALIVASAFVPAALWALVLRGRTAPDDRPPIVPLGVLETSHTDLMDVVTAVIVAALTIAGIVLWRNEPLLRWTAVAFAAQFLVYEADTYHWLAITRVGAAGAAVGAVALYAYLVSGRSTSGATGSASRSVQELTADHPSID